MPDTTDINSGSSAEFLAIQQKAKDANLNEQTLLATDYLNHFNEIVMLLEMVPDMPECLDEAKEWQPKSYTDHFRDSTFSDKELAIEAYAHVPERFLKPFEQTIDQINRLIDVVIQRLEKYHLEGDEDRLRLAASDDSRNIQRLMDFASGVIHGSDNTMDQDDIDSLLEG